jgi:hypothetical protein
MPLIDVYNLPIARSIEPPPIVRFVPEQSNVIVESHLRNLNVANATEQRGRFADAMTYQDSPFPALFSRIDSLSRLQDDWNSYGSARPNKTALFWSRRVLQELVHLNFSPLTINASSDEGVAIFFSFEGKRASIECLNDGDILAVLSEGTGAPRVWTIPQTQIKRSVSTIQTFLTK